VPIHNGVISSGTRGNAVPIVEKLPERMGTTLPLLKCLRTQHGRHCEPFSGPKCTKLQNFAYTISKFCRGNTPTFSCRSALVLGPRHQFPLGSPAFLLFLFYETTTDPRYFSSKSATVSQVNIA